MGRSRVGRACAMKQHKVRKQDCGLMLQLVGGGAQSSQSLPVGSSTTSRYLFLMRDAPFFDHQPVFLEVLEGIHI